MYIPPSPFYTQKNTPWTKISLVYIFTKGYFVPGLFWNYNPKRPFCIYTWKKGMGFIYKNLIQFVFAGSNLGSAEVFFEFSDAETVFQPSYEERIYIRFG